MPKISIITVNYNNRNGLENTIASVIEQQDFNFEYIIVDGNSNDGSKEVLNQYDAQISKWISEPDQGVYEAMNKGIHMSTGDYLLFLNSGDVLYKPTILKEVDKLILGDIDLYYGNLIFVHNGQEKLREYPKKLRFSYFMSRSLPHPGTFIRRSLFDDIFYYSEKFKIVSDWEFFIYAVCKQGASYKFLNTVISKFELDGMSNDPENKLTIEEERKIVLQKHFPVLYEDYLELTEQRKILEGKDIKIQRELQLSSVGKRVSIRIQKLLLRLFRNKNAKDL